MTRITKGFPVHTDSPRAGLWVTYLDRRTQNDGLDILRMRSRRFAAAG